MTADLLRRYRWHRAQGAPAHAAIDYARAEMWAEGRIEFEWVDCPYPYDADVPLPKGCGHLDCIAYAVCPDCGTRKRVVASLGSIAIWPGDDAYARTIEAELACEAMHDAHNARAA